MDPVLEDALKQNIDKYNELLEKRQLTKENIQLHKTNCIEAIGERMLHVDRNSDEYKECAFLVNALSNGWLVSDINVLRDYYQAVQKTDAGSAKKDGEANLYLVANYKVDKLMDRFDVLNRMNTNIYSIKFDHKDDPLFTNTYTAISRIYNNRAVYPVEYPDDPDFIRTAGKEDLTNGVAYSEISNDDARSRNFREMQDERRRTNDEYYIPQQEDALNEELAEKFETEWLQRVAGGITKKTSQIIRMSMGSDVYDEIHEMSRGSVQDRKVKLHHSLGTKYQKQGHDVLEMEFAGTGGTDVYRAHKGRKGKITFEHRNAEGILETYGTKVKKPGTQNQFFDFIWRKERTIQVPGGESAQKVRYTFGGPNYPNMGDYSVQSSRDNAQYLAGEFLQKRFDEWLAGKQPSPIHLELSGHSRGAVTAGQAVIKIDQWVTDYIKTHPGAEKFKDFVNYDLILRDPVPGFGTNTTIGDCDLRKIPNVNATVLCSLGINAPDVAFPLQHIRGAKKLILSTMNHEMEITKTDNSQNSVIGNSKEGHMVSFYDSETGEMHRGSGLSELPDGIYMQDEKYRLVRVTSYSQVKEMFNATFDKTSAQGTRARRIHKMVRDWFCENELQMSFPDETTRKAEEAKNEGVKDKILGMNVKRLGPVQVEIRMVNHMKAQPNMPKEAIIEANKILIEACRKYMKDTSMPPKGISADKAGLVGDVLSFAMKENNQLSKELNLVPANDPKAVLDEKIRAQKERLESRKGYLEIKQSAEKSRLEDEKEIQKIIKKTKTSCKENLVSLQQIGNWKKRSSKFKSILEEGSKLGDKTSVREMKDFLKRLTELSKKEHFEDLRKAGATMTVKLESLAVDKGNLDIPIGTRIKNREENLSYLKSKELELENKALEQAKAQQAKEKGKQVNEQAQNNQPQENKAQEKEPQPVLG